MHARRTTTDTRRRPPSSLRGCTVILIILLRRVARGLVLRDSHPLTPLVLQDGGWQKALLARGGLFRDAGQEPMA